MYQDTIQTSLTLECAFKKDFFMSRYIFRDKEGFYYLWQLVFSEYGLCIEITAMKQKKGEFLVVQTPKVGVLIAYLKDMLSTKNSTFIKDFFETIALFEFKIDKKYRAIFGDKFCNTFLCEQDREFILRETNAKHLVIDFAKIKKREKVFYFQPEIFPLYIPQVGVTLTNEAKLFKDSYEITIELFWDLYETYKKTLIQEISQKDKIFLKIEKDLEARYNKMLKQMKTEKIADYEVEAEISVYDGFLSEYEILNIIFSKYSFNAKNSYSLESVYGIDIKVGSIFYFLIDRFGIEVVKTKLHYFSEIKISNQKFFTL